jgi:hypothetical protein
VLLSTLVFSNNIIKSASEFQFRTFRDGSEALVLGRIFADVEGIQTDRANLGFIEKNIITKNADVLAVYNRLDVPNAVMPYDLNDKNWSHGNGTFDAVFLLQRTDVAKLGYASNELAVGQKIRFSNGEIRVITKVALYNLYLQVYYSGAKLEGAQFGYPNLIEVMDSKNYVFDGYKSQYGLQGVVFSYIYRHIAFFETVGALQFLNAALFAVVLVLLCREYKITFENHFGLVFLISMLGSPWIVSFARNLYWVPFLWFLPALIVMWLYRSKLSNSHYGANSIK